MSTAIIDNSSLTALQRLYGDAPVRTKEASDGDIMALENVLVAYLFYDTIHVIDDYKKEYSEARKQMFPQFEFTKLPDDKVSNIEKRAREEFKKDMFVIKGGEFKGGAVSSFFKQVNMHMICTWDISSSVYYLNLKLLGSPETGELKKCDSLVREIFNSLSDKRESKTNLDGNISKTIKMVDCEGDPVDDSYIIPWAERFLGKTGGRSGALETFMSSLLWSAFRTRYYEEVAKYCWADLALHPIRQTYLASRVSCSTPNQVVYSLLEEMRRETACAVTEDSCAKSGLIADKVPLFSLYCIDKCAGDPREIMNVAEGLKKSPIFIKARDELRDIRKSFDEGDQIRLIKSKDGALRDFRETLQDIRSQYGRGDQQGISLSRIILPMLNFFGADVPSGVSGLIPDIRIKTPFHPHASLSGVFRSVTNDLTEIGKIGRYHEMLTSKVRVDDNLPVYSLKAESERWKHKNSKWKCYM